MIEASKEQPVIVDFMMQECKACEKVGQAFDEAADKFESQPINFVKFDIFKAVPEARGAGIERCPTV